MRKERDEHFPRKEIKFQGEGSKVFSILPESLAKSDLKIPEAGNISHI